MTAGKLSVALVIVILVSCGVSVVGCPCAQAAVGWSKTYGGAGNDAACVVVQTSDGGYALGGNARSFGAGSSDFWLVKMDAVGNVQWNKTYGGTGYDECYSVILTNDGGYALAGITDSFGAGGDDLWLVKVDGFGVIPEGLAIEVMLVLSTIAVIVGKRFFPKTRITRHNQVNL